MYNMLDSHHLDTILDIILSFNRERKYDKLLDSILSNMMKLTHSDAGTLYLLQDNSLHFCIVKNNTLNINQSMGEASQLPQINLDKSNLDNVSAYAAIRKCIVTVNDVYSDTRFNFSGPKNYDKMTGYKTKSMLVLPLLSFSDEDSEILGVIQLINTQAPGANEVGSFSDVMDESVLMALSTIVAGVLTNFLRIHEINQLFVSFVDVTTQAIAERSSYSKNHTEKVAGLCKAFAEYLSVQLSPGDKYYFFEHEIDKIALAALFHDIGKIITPLEIMDKADRLGEKMHNIRDRFAIKLHQLEIQFLTGRLSEDNYKKEKTFVEDSLALVESVNLSGALTDEQLQKVKTLKYMTYTHLSGQVVPLLSFDDMNSLSIRYGTLTAEERTIMQEHVMVTQRLLNKIAFPTYYSKVAAWAGNHHEFLNGTGYPNNLTQDEIDIGSRIITIADIFEALVSHDRPYKKSVSVDKAFEIIEQMADEGKLDWELVQLFKESEVWKSIVE